MFKKIVSTILAAAMLATVASAASSNTQTATPTPHAIYVDGEKANVAAYEISGNNYFKLRDIAAIVNGSEKQFEVSWNEPQQRIHLTSGKAYTTVGGELGAISSANQSANASTAVVYKDGSKADYTGYNINDNNFYKLRDVCQSFDIGVEWNGANQRVDIITTESYVPEGQQPTEEPETPITEPETPVTKPEEPATEPEAGVVYAPSGRRILYGTAASEKDEVPALGEYTQAYTEFLNTCGEEIITKTIRYKIVTKGVVPYKHATELLVETNDPFMDEHTNVMLTKCNSDGTGEFTLKMPKSYYDKTMAGQYQIGLRYVGTTNLIDGDLVVLTGGIVDKYALSGYRVQYVASIRLHIADVKY